MSGECDVIAQLRNAPVAEGWWGSNTPRFVLYMRAAQMGIAM